MSGTQELLTVGGGGRPFTFKGLRSYIIPCIMVWYHISRVSVTLITFKRIQQYGHTEISVQRFLPLPE